MTPYKPILPYFNKFYGEAYIKKKASKSLYENLKINHFNDKNVFMTNYVN